jgi:fatty-acyl-CoA synthase
MNSSSPYDALPKTPANHVPLTPLSFIARAAKVFADEPAVIHGEIQRTWRETYARVRKFASALTQAGVKPRDTVSVMLPNTPPMVEAHFGVPMTGAVLNALNTRLDAAAIAWMLDHSETRVVLVDREFADVMRAALSLSQVKPLVIDVDDALYTGPGEAVGEAEYETFLARGDAAFEWAMPEDEWNAIALGYTSGTTGDPKGVVTHHRGAYLNAVSNIVTWTMPHYARYLWTLPMFHCNGWCFPWTLAAIGGVNVCLRRVEAEAIFHAIRTHGVTHYCGAPVVHSLLINAPDALKAGIEHQVSAMVAAAAPPASMIEGMEALGFDLTHVYGLTEVYGPAVVCVKKPNWAAADIGERTRLMGRQGVAYPLEEGVTVMNPETMCEVPADGETMGEIMFRGNIMMKGYLKNPAATQAAFAGGWFHSGDLGVLYPDHYVKIKDRSKDIIISGGENISSLEIEDALYRHPAILACAVVAAPDSKWGETPCAFVELKPGVSLNAEEVIAHARKHLAGFKLPRQVVFGTLPKTSTGKIQKFALRAQAKSAAAIDV